jgi:hypothetical protein
MPDPGRAREFEVLAIALLVAMAVASASDFKIFPNGSFGWGDQGFLVRNVVAVR